MIASVITETADLYLSALELKTWKDMQTSAIAVSAITAFILSYFIYGKCY
jgi:hypothetical protein